MKTLLLPREKMEKHFGNGLALGLLGVPITLLSPYIGLAYVVILVITRSWAEEKLYKKINE